MMVRDLLELCRISNLPTVWSNTWLGFVAGTFVYGMRYHDHVSPGFPKDSAISLLIAATLLAIAMSLVYCGGMVMNDYIDRRLDAEERPRRPIPSGRVKPASALCLASAMLAVGIGIGVTLAILARDKPGLLGPGVTWFVLLLASVVGYNLLHHHMWAILLMGLCRALIVLGCSAVLLDDHWFTDSWQAMLWIGGPAATLLLYTLSISVVARQEVVKNTFAGPEKVMNMIATMPLLDAIWLALLLMVSLHGKSGDGLPVLVIVVIGFPLACAGLTKLAHRRVAGS